MSLPKIEYKYFLAANIVAVLILVSAGFMDSGRLEIIKIAGIICLALAVLLWIPPLKDLRTYGKVSPGKHYFDTEIVVRNGIYSVIRHPQYLAYMLLAGGFAAISQHLLIVLLAVADIVLFYLHTLQEEQALQKRFGIIYRKYCREVPRFNLLTGLWRYFFHK